MAVELIERDGEQVRVETGAGRIEKIEPKGDRNAQVTISAEHLQEPVTSWVDRNSTDLWARCRAACERGMLIEYRIEVHRRRAATAPAGTPLDKLPKRDKVRDLVAIERPAAPMTAPGRGETVAPGQGHQLPGDRAPAPASAPAAPPPRPAPPSPAAPRPSSGEKPRRRHVQVDAKTAGLRMLADTLRDPEATKAFREDVLQACRRDGATDAECDAAWRGERPPMTAEEAIADAEYRAALAEWNGQTPAVDDGPPLQEPPEPDEEPERAPAPPARPVSSPPGSLATAARDAAVDPDRVGVAAPRPAPVVETGQVPEPEDGTAAAGQPGRAPAVSAVSGLSRRPVSIASDGRPWEATNSDGRVNMSSYAVAASVEMTTLAGRLLVTRNRQRHAEDPQRYPLQAPSRQQIGGLAALLLNSADQVQARIRSGEPDTVARVDRMASSHKLARNAIREAIDLYPIPWGAEPADRVAWQETVVDYAATILGVGVHLVGA